MSNLKTHINPLAKSKNDPNHKAKTSKSSKLTNQFSWVIILVFSVSTFAALGLIFNEIKGNVGLAAQDFAGYSTWKTQYGLKASDVDTNWNKAGDGISNYNKYLLGLNPNEVVDGSVLVTSSSKTGPVTGGTSNKSDLTGKLAASTDPTSKTIETNGPSLAANTNTTPNIGSSTAIKPNISESTSPKSANPTSNVPILGNPTPNAAGQIVASNPSSVSTGTPLTSSPTGSITAPQGASTTNSSISAGSASNTVKTSGSAASTSTTTTGTTASVGGTAISSGSGVVNSTVNTSGVSSGSVVAGQKTVTDRTGGEFSVVLYIAGLASLVSGAYILKTKFTKNNLAVQQGEK